MRGLQASTLGIGILGFRASGLLEHQHVCVRKPTIVLQNFHEGTPKQHTSKYVLYIRENTYPGTCSRALGIHTRFKVWSLGQGCGLGFAGPLLGILWFRHRRYSYSEYRCEGEVRKT